LDGRQRPSKLVEHRRRSNWMIASGRPIWWNAAPWPLDGRQWPPNLVERRQAAIQNWGTPPPQPLDGRQRPSKWNDTAYRCVEYGAGVFLETNFVS
jgi:hypothetical protein